MLAYGPVPDIPLGRNPIVLSLLILMAASALLFVVPPIFDWGWKAKYFGCTGLCLASFSLLAVVPCFVLFLYGKVSYPINITIAVVYVVSHFLWCGKFFIIYDHVFANEELRKILYREE